MPLSSSLAFPHKAITALAVGQGIWRRSDVMSPSGNQGDGELGTGRLMTGWRSLNCRSARWRCHNISFRKNDNEAVNLLRWMRGIVHVTSEKGMFWVRARSNLECAFQKDKFKRLRR